MSQIGAKDNYSWVFNHGDLMAYIKEVIMCCPPRFVHKLNDCYLHVEPTASDIGAVFWLPDLMHSSL